jgi:pimeloyl-ACP methyl ester carboxylesterase
MEDEVQIRIHGGRSPRTLIYLPGLHGDGTLIGGFRHALGSQARFVEITYPRTLTWSLDDYAAAIETALAKNGVTRGWLLGESYGSQVAGGFVKHPLRRLARLAEKLTGRISNALFVRIIFGYAKIARFRYRCSPATLATLDEFIARRTELDRRAAQHRLHLVAKNDPRLVASQAKLPIFGLSGILDPIVPWPLVRRWLRRNCPALRDYQIIRHADHNVLSTAPAEAAKQILEWMALLPAGTGLTQPNSET